MLLATWTRSTTSRPSLPGDRAGPHRVPAISSSRAPADRLGDGGLGRPGAAFTAVTQLGTELAVLLYFGKDIVRIAKAWFASLPARRWPEDPDARMGWLVIFGSMPIVILGLPSREPDRLGLPRSSPDRDQPHHLRASSRARRSTLPQRSRARKLTVKHGIVYGFAQAMALLPGVSRSGGTITAGACWATAARPPRATPSSSRSPAGFGSGIYKLKDIGEGDGGTGWGPTIAATIVAFIVGYAVIAWLMRTSRRAATPRSSSTASPWACGDRARERRGDQPRERLRRAVAPA